MIQRQGTGQLNNRCDRVTAQLGRPVRDARQMPDRDRYLPGSAETLEYPVLRTTGMSRFVRASHEVAERVVMPRPHCGAGSPSSRARVKRPRRPAENAAEATRAWGVVHWDAKVMTEHTVRAYNEELAALDRKLAQMGGICEDLLAWSAAALERRDPALANRVIARDRAVDALQNEIEEQAVQLIARRQPMANDLRQIMAVMRIASDLERIGDLAKNISKRVLVIASEPYPRPLISGLQRMVELAMAQLKEVLDAYAERNAELAMSVWHQDEHLDATYNSVFRELLTYMMEDPRNIGLCTHLLFGAKNLERIGDHTTNIAETVHFVVRGVALTEARPKGDTTSTTLMRGD